MIRFLAALWAVVFTLALTGAGQVQAQSDDDIVWVQIEAHSTLAVATDRARFFAGALEDVNGFSLGGGWYGIAVGPYRRADAVQVLRSYIRDRLIPRDSFIQTSDKFRQQFWPVGANVLSTGVVDAPVVTQGAQTETPAPADPVVTQAPAPEPADETVSEARRSERALSAQDRKDLQIALQWAGYYNAAIDGAYGRGTRNSMSAWQEANGFEATGVLTTLQRATLLQQYNAVLDGLGLQVVTNQRAGIEMIMPTAEVRLGKVEPPFVQYDSSGDIGARVLLISQEGTQSTLFGLYEIMQTLEIVPLNGPRTRNNASFELKGENSRIVSETSVTLRDGHIKGFTLIWPAGDEDRRTRVMAEMRKSFVRLPAVLDPAAGGQTEQAVDLVAGLQIRQPKISRSGFFIDTAGTVATTSETIASCDRLTIDGDADADVLVNDPQSGLALLRPRDTLAPLAVATFDLTTPRLQSDVSVAGYSYEGVLSAATLTFGKLEDFRGLNGEDNLNRLTLKSQPGDAGGPIFDARGSVIGMLQPKTDADRQLPGDVSFALNSTAIADAAASVSAALNIVPRPTNIAPRDLRLAAQGMTVLVSCWD